VKTSFEIFLGLRYLRSKRKRKAISVLTWISVIGVAIGVMALNVVLSVVNGFDEELKAKIVGLNPHIFVTGFQRRPLSNYNQVTEAILKMNHVKSVGPYIEGQALAKSRALATGIEVWGVDPDRPGAVIDLNKYLWEAKSTDLKSPPPDGSGRPERIFLGSVLAQRLQVTVGDDIVIFLPILQQTPMGMMPQSMKFQVVGLLSTGTYDYDFANAYVSLANGQKMYRLEDNVTGVAVKVDNVDLAPEVAKEIRSKFSSGYLVQDWLQMNRNLFIALRMEKLVLGIIVSLIILVATLNIVNPLTMMVVEKTREIGILKAMGSTDGSVMRIFIFQGLFIGFVGTLIGLVLGYILCIIIMKVPISMPGNGTVYLVDRLPAKIDPFLFYFVTPVASMVLCFLATLYPARQASKLEPVDAIRFG
jgi:lipoprotein-releasing system permease protein